MTGNLHPITLVDYKPLRELVFEALRDAIINGQLRPGERLMEVQVAEALGVSRTPVREAIRMLEREGLVLMMPRKGAYVSDISVKDIASVFEIRRALEALAAELAAERATEDDMERLERILLELAKCVESGDVERYVELDTEFHATVYRASRNERLAPIINSLREQIQRFRTRSLSNPGRMKMALEEHRKLVEAIGDRDVERARQLAAEHIDNAENVLMTLIKAEESKERESKRG